MKNAITTFNQRAQCRLKLRFKALLIGVIFMMTACSIQPQPPKDWGERVIVYKSLSSDTGFAGYYISYQEKNFLTFSQFLSTIPSDHQWKQQSEAVWELNVPKYDMDLSGNGPIKMYFKIKESSSGKVNVLLMKAVTEDFEVPWILLDQIVMQAGERFNKNSV